LFETDLFGVLVQPSRTPAVGDGMTAARFTHRYPGRRHAAAPCQRHHRATPISAFPCYGTPRAAGALAPAAPISTAWAVTVRCAHAAPASCHCAGSWVTPLDVNTCCHTARSGGGICQQADAYLHCFLRHQRFTLPPHRWQPPHGTTSACRGDTAYSVHARSHAHAALATATPTILASPYRLHR